MVSRGPHEHAWDSYLASAHAVELGLAAELLNALMTIAMPLPSQSPMR